VLAGSGLEGTFHTWESGERSRYEENIGGRTDVSLRIGEREYIVNQNGNVRELHGLLLARQRTEDFIARDDFVSQPQYDSYLGEKQLPDGRTVDEVAVAPPHGQREVVDLDAKTLMVDRTSFDEEDGTSTEDYFDYRTVDGVLIAQREIDSNGDHVYDVMHLAEHIVVDRPIASEIFAVPQTTVVQTDKPVTVPLEEHDGHLYTKVRIGGHSYTFLVDTGAQAVVVDSRVAAQLGLQPQGHLEVSGTTRTGGLGIADLDSIQIGEASLPVREVSVLDLQGATGSFNVDGVLGYPFFAAAEVTIDPVALTMTFAKPGALHPRGNAIPIDVDRQLVELTGKVNGTEGRFVIDTGNSTELLLFDPFMRAHPYVVAFQPRSLARDYGVGGSAPAVNATIDELDVGTFRLFNRYANLMLTNRGAFADRFDAGNIGMGTLRNFIVTFDLSNERMFMQPSAVFDDGSRRPRYERVTP